MGGQVGPYSVATKPIYVRMYNNKMYTRYICIYKTHNLIIYIYTHKHACFAVLYHTRDVLYRGVVWFFRHRREAIKNDKTCYYVCVCMRARMRTRAISQTDHSKRYHLSFVVHKVRKTGIHSTIIHARRHKPCTSF